VTDYLKHDRAVWERLFATMPAEWYDAPPSDAIEQCRAYFAKSSCTRLLDIGCGFGRWAHFLVGHGVDEVVGIDYAVNGVRAATAWARRAGSRARFVATSATALPFRERLFDGVLAALLLDNLSRVDCAVAVQGLNGVTKHGAHGFFVFNPVMTESELATVRNDNPTKECRRVDYRDEELSACLSGWSISRLACTRERFRVIEAVFQQE
jgi:ubiquinone/menaquinone biosynthesis C-methylase UbiE